jgi:hypothetical protein
MLYGLGIAQAVLTPLIGKIVTMVAGSRSLNMCKFDSVSDPLTVTVVKRDGTPYSPTIQYTVPLADIVSAQEYIYTGQGVTATEAAATTTNWLLYGAIAVGGFFALKYFGVFGKTKKSRR